MKHSSKLFLIPLLLALGACGNLNPFSKAETLEQKSYALYGSFVVFEEQAAKVMESPEVPNSVKFRIQVADRDAKPVADSLRDAAESLIVIKREYEMGTTEKSGVDVAIENLAGWYEMAKPKINCFIRTVEGKSCSN